MPSHSSLYDLKMLIVHHSPDIPILPRQMYAIHRLQMDWDCCSSCSFLHTYPHGPGLVHRYVSFEPYGHVLSTGSHAKSFPSSLLLIGHLPPEPLPRFSPAQIRPIPHTRRRSRRRRRLATHPTHETRRRVPPLYKAAAGIQVLAQQHKGNCDCVLLHLVGSVQCTGLLASTCGVLHYSV